MRGIQILFFFLQQITWEATVLLPAQAKTDH